MWVQRVVDVALEADAFPFYHPNTNGAIEFVKRYDEEFVYAEQVGFEMVNASVQVYAVGVSFDNIKDMDYLKGSFSADFRIALYKIVNEGR